MKLRAGSLKKISRIDKPLARLKKKKREGPNKSEIKKEVLTNTTKIQSIIR